MRPSKTKLAAAGIFSAVSGALALYLAKRPDLRKELTKADTPAEALKTFGDHMQEDGNKFVDHLRGFLKKHRVSEKTKKATKKVKAAAKRGVEALEAMQDKD